MGRVRVGADHFTGDLGQHPDRKAAVILHITRHGQTDVKSDHPPGDPHLTDLGRRQARRLGQALEEMGFAGVIYSSPYFRTMETAQVVAEAAGAPVEPAAEMREYVIRENQMDAFTGATQGELAAAYSRVTRIADFPYPWWTTKIESDEDVEARVAPVVARAVAAGVDALLVGHGASAAGVHRHLLGHHDPDRESHGQVGRNCFLSSFSVESGFRPLRIMDVAHLPDDMVTSNAMTRDEVLAGL